MEGDSTSSSELDLSEEQNGRKSFQDMKKKGPKKRRKKGSNEPQKPVSAYALFFRDTQSAIKTENPSATFGEISKIVAAMWDGLTEEAKQVYKQKTETAKRDYLKQLAAYRANQVSRSSVDGDEEDSQPLLVLKMKIGQRKSALASTASYQTLPPPPKLQMAPNAASKGLSSQQQGYSPTAHTPPTPHSMINVISPTLNSQTLSPSPNGSPSVQHIMVQSIPSYIPPSPSNLPPIQLRNIVPKPQAPITILQSKPGQVIKLLPASQVSTIASKNDGKNRIIKMADLIHSGRPVTSQPNTDNVQPILQTLAQEHNTSLHDPIQMDGPPKLTSNNNTQTNCMKTITSNQEETFQPLTTLTSIEPNIEYRTASVRVCIREGCSNLAVSDPQWNEEYCSSECVVRHCNDVFNAWTAARQVTSSVN